jgi:hypothetical protein
MKFSLTIELGNDAMQNASDVARALRKLAGKIDLREFDKIDGGKIMDVNGNSVGEWEVSE